MISVKRTPQPRILVKKATIWTQKYSLCLSIYNTSPIPANLKKLENSEKKYAHSEIKESLKAMFAGKCAYCESYILHIDYADIEHFKPKSLYPTDCFNWENLLLACGKCNGKEFKGDKFPLVERGGPYINPVIDNPKLHFNFEFDPSTGTANVIPLDSRGFLTEKDLGLNRPELVRHRSEFVQLLAFIAIKAKEGDGICLLKIRELSSPNQQYSAFARAFIEKLEL